MNVIEIFPTVTNATSSVSTVFNVLGTALLLGACIGILSLLFYVSGNIEKYRRFRKLFTSLYKMFSYAAYGLLTIAVVGLPLLGIYQLTQMVGNNPTGAIEAIKTIGIIVGAFVGVTLVGYVTKNRVWKRIFKFHSEEKNRNQPVVEETNNV
jgi:hypothetical protein